MSLVFFEGPPRSPGPAQTLAWAWLAGIWLLGVWGLRARGVPLVRACVFLSAALTPLFPAPSSGCLRWPATSSAAAGLARAALAGLAGASLMRPNGGSPYWRGTFAGLAAVVAAEFARRGLWLARGLSSAGLSGMGWTLAAAVLLALPIVGALWVWTALSAGGPLREEGAAGRLPLGACLAAGLLWIVPSVALQSYLTSVYDYGSADLATAAGLTPLPAGRRVVAVFCAPDGGPGVQTRVQSRSAAGVAVDPASLRKIRAYLEARELRSVHVRQAIAALRAGWLVEWGAAERLEALALGGDSSPPDYLGFLEAIRIAPTLPENLARLEALAAKARKPRFVRVDLTQRLFEGFSAAFAHFGEAARSNEWIDRVQGLWPLMSEEVRVEPIEQDLSCRILGRVESSRGALPESLQIGLFAAVSTSTALSGQEGLVDSVRPDSDGRFEFSALVPGRYYLALQANEREMRGLRAAPGPGLLRVLPENPVVKSPPLLLEWRSNFATIEEGPEAHFPER